MRTGRRADWKPKNSPCPPGEKKHFQKSGFSPNDHKGVRSETAFAENA